MKKIVVGTDGSESARHALEWAYEEARLAAAELVVVHSWEYPYPDVSGSTSDTRDRMRRDAEKELDEAVAVQAERGRADGVIVRKHLVESAPAKALIDESEGADLVVVGSRGRGGFASLLLGSVSRAVVQHAHCPIAVIRHPKH
jgi:nucleotide-binding universal stress UspA family protein